MSSQDWTQPLGLITITDAMYRLTALSIASTLVLVPSPLRADPMEKIGEPHTGLIRSVFVGASFTNSQGLDNGVNCLKSSATTVVDSADIPSRAKLLKATLYVAGSLLDDGLDFQNPDIQIFDAAGSAFGDPDDEALYTLARQEATKSVSFLPPGTTTPITVTAPGDAPNITGFYEDATAGTPGNVAFYVTPFDVTEVMNNQGGGALDGTYTVSDIRADVCWGLEVSCDDPGDPPSCGTPHAKANASFGLLLIFEDPSLPPSSITVFEGLQHWVGGELLLQLSTPHVISDPPVGTLAMLALEGDLTSPQVITDTAPCGGQEYIRVHVTDDPEAVPLCLVDDDNPVGNIFNSTINVQNLGPGENRPVCTLAPHQCCNPLTNTRCGETGIDIDQFSISSALVPGAKNIEVSLGTGDDVVALGVVVVSAGVFRPVLEADSRVTALTGVEGAAQLGAIFEYSVALSNTGNPTSSAAEMASSAVAAGSTSHVVMPAPAS